jgi:hypothetical protein
LPQFADGIVVRFGGLSGRLFTRGWILGAAAILTALIMTVSSAEAVPPSAVRVGAAPHRPPRTRVLGALPASAPIHINVTLRPRDPAGLASYAAAVSTPGSPLYHRFLTVGQFRQRFGPGAGQIAAVQSSLRAHGLPPAGVSANGLAISVSSSAGGIARAFSLSFDRLALPSGRTAFANNQAPQFDSSVAGDVQAVVGLDSISVPRPQAILRPHAVARAPVGHAVEGPAPRVVTGGPQPCAQAAQTAPGVGAYTADQLASAYRFSSLYGVGDQGAGQTIALFELEPNNASDIAAYQSCYGTSAAVSYVGVDGGSGTGAGQGEAALDIEDVIGLAPKASVLVYQGPNTGSGAYDTYSAIVSQDRAQVISTSWGVCEPNEQGTATAQAENTLFQEAAVQGQSVFAAAGDSGSEDCQTSSLAVDDPASQPYVTGVGGTTMSTLGPPATESVWNERAAGAGAGGGGISSVWTMPSYQTGTPPPLNVVGSWSSGSACGAARGSYCREVPDVSADADPYTGYLVYYNGGWGGIGGTSAAAPLWAAFMALVNASSACNGTSVGFANPALYRAAASGYSTDFGDITSGNNDYTATNGGAFAAGPGYDPASGLGTPVASSLPAALCSRAGSGGSTITVADPGNQTSAVGTAANLQIEATDSASGAALTYAATGLPAGLSIDPATGVISGVPTTAGSSTATVTVSDAAGASASTSFQWTIALRTSATSVTCSPAALLTGATTTCTATVSDSETGQPSTPAGTMTFSSSASGSFGGGSACTLAPAGAGASSCSVIYQPQATGAQQITAGYSGDTAHRSSASAAALTVSAPPAPSSPSPPTSPSTPGGSGSPTSVGSAVNSAWTAQIGGTPRAGALLTCPSGPASTPSYQWARDGTPIAGATSARYRVQALDDGTTLTCVVTVASAPGVRAPIASASIMVPVPFVAGCPAATGRASGATLGLVSLGMTRRQARRAYARSRDRAGRSEDVFCLTPAGVRVGYASPALLRLSPWAERNSLHGRVVWISTASAYYAVNGVRVGATLTAAARHLRLSNALVIGSGRWYLAPGGRATVVLNVRNGIVQQIGLAAPQLTASRAAARALLTSF